MKYTDTDIYETMRILGEMLAGKQKETVQEYLNQLVKEIGYNEVSGKCKFYISVNHTLEIVKK